MPIHKHPNPQTITVVGEALMDVVSSIGGEVTHVGGGPANVAVSIARLGHLPTLIAQVGEDEFGIRIREHLASNDVHLEAAGSPAPSARSTARLDASGAASYEFDMRWDVADLALAPGSAALCVGSLGLVIEPGRQAVEDLVDKARAEGVLIAYDPNVRPSLVPDRDALRRAVDRIAAGSHLVKLSDEDLAYLFPGLDEIALAELWLRDANDLELLVVTRGAKPAFWATRTAQGYVSGPDIEVVDTIGAGDSFLGGLLTGLADLGALSPSGLANASRALVESVVTRAARIAAITCTRAGANPPRLAELEASGS